MKERVKVFTYTSGTGAAVIQSSLEDHINEWLAGVHGRIVRITQSESERPKRSQTDTVLSVRRGCCVYLPV
jgi:hypothetical protein